MMQPGTSISSNNALTQTFNVNGLNELTTGTGSGTLTVAGTTTSAATNVTVNTLNAILYGDYTFASTNQSLADGNNTFTAIAKDSYGRRDTNTINCYLPSTSTFTYDQNGNLTGDGKRCFAYDDENQLISVWVTNAWRSDFTYDGKMRRRIRREYTWQSANWNLQSEIHYVYDGNLVIQERDANNLALVTYTRGRDLSGSLQGAGGIGGLLARTDNRLFAIGDSSAHAYYHADGNGNITCLINRNQINVAHYLYDPYGNILSQSGLLADANLYRFSSKEFHVASGLVYYLYRFYEGSLQRWLNRDPVEDLGFVILAKRITFDGSDSPNAYTFVGNDSIANIDAHGLTLYYCTVPTTSFPTFGIGRHGYLWNDATGDECGQESSCGSGPTKTDNGGPGPKDTKPDRSGRVCTPIEGTEGTDSANADLMAWCHQHANDGVWIPGAHDCHNVVNKCLKHGGLQPILFPGRFHPQPIFGPVPRLSSSPR